MKQFNLEEYLNNPSKKVVTREGRIARIICTDRVSKNYPLLALVMMEDKETPFSYTRNGKFYENQVSGLDLFFAPEKHEGWVNIYKAGAQRETLGCLPTRYVGSSIWPTKVAAKAAADADDIVTIKIEWEE